MSNSSIWPFEKTLSGTTTLGQSGPESNGNEMIHLIPQKSKTEASSSVRLTSYPGHLLGEFYPSAEMQLLYSTVPADEASMCMFVE